MKGGLPDRLPIFDFIDSPNFIERIIGRKPEDYTAQDIMEVTLKYGFDGAFIGYGGFGGYDTFDAPVDFPVRDWNDLRRYRLPDPELPERMDEIVRAQQLGGDEIAIVGGVQGPLTTAILLSGLTNFFTKIVDDPSFVTEIFKFSNAYFKVAVNKMVEAKVDVICIPEDLGFASGPFFSVEHFRKLLLPFIEELFDAAISQGVPTFLHCDGNINAYLDDLLSIGFNGLHPIQRTACMSINKVREKSTHKLCLIGNVDSSHTLVFGNENEIIQQTLEVIRDGALQGALILASDSDIRDEMPYEKVDLMFRTGLEYGKYPIDVEALDERIKQCSQKR